MKPGYALADMSCVEVLKTMRRLSGLRLSEIAEAMDRDEATAGGWFAAGADRYPPLPLVPSLCACMGDPLLIEWLQAQYERLRAGEASLPGGADAACIRDRLFRALTQVSAAIDLVRALGQTLTKTESRQVSEAILLAAATLAAAAREARGGRAASRGPRFASAATVEAWIGERPSVWRRLAAWFGGWSVAARLREELTQLGQAHARELVETRAAHAVELVERDRQFDKLARLFGAAGWILGQSDTCRVASYDTVSRLLLEGEQLTARE